MSINWQDRVFTAACWMSAIVLIGAVLAILAHLLVQGGASLTPRLLFGGVDPWPAIRGAQQVFDGIYPAVAGTVVLVLLAVGLALPLGIAGGVYFALYAPPKVKPTLSLLVDILASIPSIVIGLFGLALVIILHKYCSPRVYPSLLISSIALACLVLPYIIRTTEIALGAVEQRLRLAAPACGASRWQNTWHVLLPQSLPGLFSGSILAVGRCAEDTAVIMLTGVVASVGLPSGLLGKYEALPFFIYYTSSQYANRDQLTQGYGAAIVLLIVCSGLFLLASLIRRRLQFQAFHRL